MGCRAPCPNPNRLKTSPERATRSSGVRCQVRMGHVRAGRRVVRLWTHATGGRRAGTREWSPPASSALGQTSGTGLLRLDPTEEFTPSTSSQRPSASPLNPR